MIDPNDRAILSRHERGELSSTTDEKEAFARLKGAGLIERLAGHHLEVDMGLVGKDTRRVALYPIYRLTQAGYDVLAEDARR